jgi:hypothetical protein
MGISRRARASDGGKHLDESVRAQLRREAAKNSDKVAGALLKGLSASDPLVSTRSAVALLEQSFGRAPSATAEVEEPSKWIQSVFRRPGRRAGEPEQLFVCLVDGRVLPVGTVVLEGPH